MTTTTPDIAIIGAGPSGLTLALLLERAGLPSYTIYERDPTPSTRGGSLDLSPTGGQLALDKAGVLPAFKRHARYDDTVFRLSDSTGGEPLLQFGQGRDAPEIDRAALREVLLGAVPEGKIRWGHVLERAGRGEGDGRPVLRFTNGTEVAGFRLVVGADGAWSKVRPMLTKSTPRYTGKTHLESSIPPSSPYHATLASTHGAGTSISIGPANHIILTQRQGDLSYRTYFGLPSVPETFFSSGSEGKHDLSDLPATRALLLSPDHFASWSEDHRSLIHNASSFRTWQLYTLAPEDVSWDAVPGFTLIGDAAHLAMPNTDGGVNVAMTDAMKLVDSIVEHRRGKGDGGDDGFDEAVRAYEVDMFPRGQRMVAGGLAMADLMFGGDAKRFLEVLVANRGEE